MDAPIVVESTAPVRDVLRDHRGTVIGRIENERRTGKFVLRDCWGVVLGTFDPRSNETRNVHGRVIGRGNLLGTMLMMEGR